MNDNKTLVNQIRDMVNESREGIRHPAEFGTSIIGHTVITRDDERELFTIIADRIEREYLPRPRFEDGELVDVGNEIDANGTRVKIKTYVVDDDGLTTFLDGKSTLGYDLEPGKPAKRWKPEVLDADGMPIKVGDHVWWKDGREFVITAVNRGVNTEAIEPVPGRCSSHVNFDPREFTHKQPDSLERIEEDAREELWHYWGCVGARCAECPALIDGKTPRDHYHTDSCGDAKFLDLLRRQRALLERGQA